MAKKQWHCVIGFVSQVPTYLVVVAVTKERAFLLLNTNPSPKSGHAMAQRGCESHGKSGRAEMKREHCICVGPLLRHGRKTWRGRAAHGLTVIPRKEMMQGGKGAVIGLCGGHPSSKRSGFFVEGG